MKRRDALQAMILFTAGSLLSPGCFVKDEIWDTQTGLIRFDNRSKEFIWLLAQLILPDREDFKYETPESFDAFVQHMLNVLHSQEDRAKYGTGYIEYLEYIKTQFNKSLNQFKDDEGDQLLSKALEESALTEHALYFFKKTRELRIQHFRSSEEYLKGYDNYEMAPGRFSGCISING